MTERLNIRHAGRSVDFFELLPAQAATKVIPVSLAGLHLEDYIIPRAEIPGHEITTHVAGVFRDSPPCFVHWTEGGRAQRIRMDPGTIGIRSPQPMPVSRSDGPTRILALSVNVETMEQALPEPFTRRPVRLAPLMAGPPDPVLTSLLGAIEAEVKTGCPAGRLLLEPLPIRPLSTWRNVTACFLPLRLITMANSPVSPVSAPIISARCSGIRWARAFTDL
jgi:hypothetical protein